MKYVSLLLVLLSFDAIAQDDGLVKTCYNLEKEMNDMHMKGISICKFSFPNTNSKPHCFFNSPQKSIGGDLEYDYAMHVPCTQFEAITKLIEKRKKGLI